MAVKRIELMLCTGTGCVAGGAFRIYETLEEEIKKHGLEKEVSVVITGCNGFCGQGPLLVVQPDEIFYGFLTPEEIPFLVQEHLLKGRPVEKLMFTPPEKKEPVPLLNEIPFFKKQLLVALRNKGIIDPEKIDDYIARDGYTALEKVLTSMTPNEVIKEIKNSGLRGRGGAGFPTGIKWEFCRAEQKTPKYLVCNCDEGDPGAYMDRSIFESDPHTVIEGMMIGAYAIGVSHAYIYTRTEYPLAIKRMDLAISHARDYGLLGENILGSGFNFNINVHHGAGAFVCGESTALMASMEGRVGEPRAKYIHNVESGFRNQPTVLNNVETWANVPVIINRGAEWFSKIGTETSKGTKIFSLVGKINNTGLIEVPMGITLGEVVYDIGGGISGNKELKAVQTGGPSGGCIPASMIDVPIDFESLTEAGSMMGSGGMIVMDEDDCMVDIAKYFINFLKDESCGKCSPCREGLVILDVILDKIANGQGKIEDIGRIEDICTCMQNAALCELGKSAPNPVLSTIKYFRDEYEAHIKEKKCPAGKCKALIEFSINDQCTGCAVCAKNCPSDAITGVPKEKYSIDQNKCIKCGICEDVCKFEAVTVQ